jgi:hypothetical protein
MMLITRGASTEPQLRQRCARASDLGDQFHLDVGVPVVTGQRAELAGTGTAALLTRR